MSTAASRRPTASSTVRRRVLRSPTSVVTTDPVNQRRIQRRRAKLEKERRSLGRWMVRLERAFHAMEKS